MVPEKRREAVISLLHERHPGIMRMKHLAQVNVWRPGMNRTLRFVVKTCAECQENQKLPARALMHFWEWPGCPWANIHIDCTGPIKDDFGGYLN